ncbi:MAG: hypothetical protein ABIO70_19670 [Pseudomonadota bacterium]
MSGGLRPGGGPTTGAGQALAQRLPPLVGRLRGPWIDALAERMRTASPSGELPEVEAPGADGVASHGAAQALLADLLIAEGRASFEARRDAERGRSAFLGAVRRASDAVALQAQLRHHLRTTRRGAALRRDLRALKRWLDADALLERMDSSIEELGIELELVARLLAGLPLREQGVELLRVLCSDPRLPTRRAAVATLASWAVARVTEGGQRALPPEILRQLLQIARQPQEDPITSRHALRVLLAVEADEQEALLIARLTPPERRAAEEGQVMLGAWLRDDFLVRAEAARVSQQTGGSVARRAFSLARKDPSETVRCALAEGLAGRSDMTSMVHLERLAREDPARSVRVYARALLGIRRGEPDARAVPDPSDDAGSAARPDEPLHALARELAGLPEGRSRTVTLPDGAAALDLARALVPWVAHDHGFSLQPRGHLRVQVLRGQRAIPRAWRVFHELRHPGPAKRQAGDHLSGYTTSGSILVPPAGMAEVSPTGVPNQRVLAPAWGSWAPWLPQPEDYLDALSRGTTRIVTREGVTTIRASASWPRRLWGALWMVGAMASLDQDRQHALAASEPSERHAYVARTARAGFTTLFEGHEDQPQVYAGLPQFFDAPDTDADLHTPGVQVFGLGGPLLLGGLRSLIGVRHNLPVELAAVCAGLAVLFLTRAAWTLYRIRRDRGRIPLVIGGWGTRGKSGTERLKAALFQGLGYDVVCKTTGCEAILLHAPPGARATELFLYRPWERASIWEHAEVMHTAAQLGAPVFLWECMALRPDYVEQLQLLWTRDDLSTVTNTYPDHEDVQGPTGRDVAETIASFIPKNALLVTTEQQMLPVLRDRCTRRGSRLDAVTAEHIASQPADLLARVPYLEHPANVALVARVAAQLGVDPEEAVILMADHVVPDLGALATYGPMRHLGRAVEFTNGMSANERTGFLNNWQRSGFSAADPARDPGTFYVTVVNNRRDRVPRSRVFAEILVQDAPAHRHVLIGTNLQGLERYLDEALHERLQRLDPFAAGSAGVARRIDAIGAFLRVVDPAAVIRATAADLRLPPTEVMVVTARIEALLAGAAPEPTSLAAARASLEPLRELLTRLASHAGGTFSRISSPPLASLHPRLEPPLFHDERDLEEGVAGLAEAWFELCAEALALRSLRRACLGEASSVDAAARPAPDSSVDDLFDDASSVELEFWAAGDDDPIATLPAEETDPGLGAALTTEAGVPVLVEDSHEPERAQPPAVPLDPSRQAALRDAVRALFREIFRAHVLVVPSSDASGDEVIDAVARACPAGARVRAMGIQNIKGTGLDFVYRWVHSAQPLRWAEDLFHPDASVQLASLSRLERWREWSIPACQEVLRSLTLMQADAAGAQIQATVRERLEDEIERRRAEVGRGGGGRALRGGLLQWLWSLWDPFDALLRRWTSDRIWSDLAHQRISHPRAARELARIAARQRGEDSSKDAALVP